MHAGLLEGARVLGSISAWLARVVLAAVHTILGFRRAKTCTCPASNFPALATWPGQESYWYLEF